MSTFNANPRPEPACDRHILQHIANFFSEIYDIDCNLAEFWAIRSLGIDDPKHRIALSGWVKANLKDVEPRVIVALRLLPRYRIIHENCHDLKAKISPQELGTTLCKLMLKPQMRWYKIIRSPNMYKTTAEWWDDILQIKVFNFAASLEIPERETTLDMMTHFQGMSVILPFPDSDHLEFQPDSKETLSGRGPGREPIDTTKFPWRVYVTELVTGGIRSPAELTEKAKEKFPDLPQEEITRNKVRHIRDACLEKQISQKEEAA